MSRTQWITASLLSTCLMLVGVSTQGPEAKKPGRNELVGITPSFTKVGALHFAVSTNGTVYTAGSDPITSNLLPFSPIAQVPPGAVSIVKGVQTRIYIGYANGDVYEGIVDVPQPWNFTLVRNVFTP